MGAWIEISVTVNIAVTSPSLPSWERGLKFSTSSVITRSFLVAPLVGAWIEIADCIANNFALWSLPSWERGLKYRS